MWYGSPPSVSQCAAVDPDFGCQSSGQKTKLPPSTSSPSASVPLPMRSVPPVINASPVGSSVTFAFTRCKHMGLSATQWRSTGLDEGLDPRSIVLVRFVASPPSVSREPTFMICPTRYMIDVPPLNSREGFCATESTWVHLDPAPASRSSSHES